MAKLRQSTKTPKVQEFFIGERVIVEATHYSNGEKLRPREVRTPPEVYDPSEEQLYAGTGIIKERSPNARVYIITLLGRWAGEHKFSTYDGHVFWQGNGTTFWGFPTLRYSIRREDPSALADIEKIVEEEARVIKELSGKSGETQRAAVQASLRNLRSYLESSGK
jgi:hypothetical protein